MSDDESRLDDELAGKEYGPITSTSNNNTSASSSNDHTDKRGNKKHKQQQKEQEPTTSKQKHMAYKYSNRGNGPLHEAVILAGKPIFLKYGGKNNGDKIVIDNIDSIEDTRVINPPHIEHYPYEPYEFENMNEVFNYIERAKKETIDSLYLQAKRIATDYNDQKQDKINLLAIEIVSSYSQDRFPTTHYDIVLGGNGSGKSSYGDTFTAVGYRVINLTDPNAANINRILGVIEVGQCTIVSDETGAIDKHPDLMAILKTGYSIKGKTSKVNDTSRNPEFFHTYCFKMIISERMPNLRDARGVLDRSFSFTTYKGRPKYDIKETLEPQGNAARQERLDILNDFRKLMLIYRLLHYKDPIEDIDVGIEGREKELAKPIIQLFYNTEAQVEVERTLQNFLNLRSEKKEITLEPILHPIVTDLVNEYGNELYVKTIWDELKGSIEDGHYDDSKPNEYHTLEYGTIYNNTISNILEHTFGGRPKHKEKGNTFIFDPEELKRVGRSYNITTNIQTKIISTEESKRISSEGSEGSAEGYLTQNNASKADNETNLREDNLANNAQKEDNNGVEPSQEAPQPSEPSGQILNSIYRLGHSDVWRCRNCKVKDDRIGMEHHVCSGSMKKT